MTQATLFDVPAPRKPPKRKTAAQRRAERDRAFRQFNASHPEVFARLRDMALAVKAKGFKRYGIRVLWEAARYQADIQTSGQPYKLQDHFTAPYARLLMATVPELAAFFETRTRD